MEPNLLIIDLKLKQLKSLINFQALVNLKLLIFVNTVIERQIKKIKTEYQDIRTNANIERLKNDLTNVQNIMADNIDLILNRGNKLEGDQ